MIYFLKAMSLYYFVSVVFLLSPFGLLVVTKKLNLSYTLVAPLFAPIFSLLLLVSNPFFAVVFALFGIACVAILLTWSSD